MSWTVNYSPFSGWVEQVRVRSSGSFNVRDYVNSSCGQFRNFALIALQSLNVQFIYHELVHIQLHCPVQLWKNIQYSWTLYPTCHGCTWSSNKVRELATVCLPWQQRTETSVWFDDADISAFHSCVVVYLWQSLSEWRLVLSECFGALHHDNAPAHTTLSMREFLGSKHITVLEHPPYSPDLAPNDFFFLQLCKPTTNQPKERDTSRQPQPRMRVTAEA
jgi:hypothetical protein